MRSTVSIDISAPADLVFRLARDVERWPALLPHYGSVHVLGRDGGAVTARFVASRPLVPALGLGLPVAWVARAWSEPESRRLRFAHERGTTRGMDVAWLIEARDTGCRVTIQHAFGPRIPGWAWFIDRGFVRPIASRTLRTFKAIAEAASGALAPDRPGTTT